MTIASHRRTHQRFGRLARALPVALALSGCHLHSAGPTLAPEHAVVGSCVNVAALLEGTMGTSCTIAQRICLLANDIPETVGQSDFVPAAGYTARWQRHVTAWLAQLNVIAKEPALDSYAQGTRHKLEQMNASEHDRRLIVDSGDLIYALKLLAQKAQTATPPIALDCRLPE